MLVNNCPAHPMAEGLQSIELVFLPLNCTSVLQPMDQGIIRLFKLHYSKQSLKMVLIHIDKTGYRLDKQLETVNAMEFVKKAWSTVSREAIHNSFLYGCHGSSSPSPHVDMAELTRIMEFETGTSIKQEVADTNPTLGKSFILSPSVC